MTASDVESPDFARAFGDALSQFLQARGITQAEAARRIGLAKGKGKARLNTYCHDSTKGKRAKPDAEILYRVCAELGFAFEYRGYKISAAVLNGNGTKPIKKQIEQLEIEFDGQFSLTDQTGTISIHVRRPPGRIEVALSLKGASPGRREK
jgi:transcriptional regulator with XRE-family HTH domain